MASFLRAKLERGTSSPGCPVDPLEKCKKCIDPICELFRAGGSSEPDFGSRASIVEVKARFEVQSPTRKEIIRSAISAKPKPSSNEAMKAGL